MKKKSIFITVILSFILLFAVVGCTTAKGGYISNVIKLSNTNKEAALNTEAVSVEVGKEFDLTTILTDSTAAKKDTLTFEAENSDIIYVTANKFKFISLMAGTTKIIVSSELYYSELTVEVVAENLIAAEGSFEDIPAGTKWTYSRQKQYDWDLYTGSASVADEQVVEVQEIDGNNVIHYKHTAQTQYSNLFKSFDVGAGQFYVTAKMKGENVAVDTYVRVNQGGEYGLTQTEKVKKTFEWTEFKSGIVRVKEGEKLKLEMYFANNFGEVWFDDLSIYKVITTDYTTFTPEKSVEKLNVGDTAQIACQTIPTSIVDYQYEYESTNQAVATVDEFGKITAIKNGFASIIVKDPIYNYKKIVKVVVGIENGITSSINNDETINLNEDSKIEIPVTSSDSTNFKVEKYTDALYGSYYIKDNKIIYYPSANMYTLEGKPESFQVLVYDTEKGYVIKDVNIEITGIYDECTTVEFWHTTNKNTNLEWVTEAEKQSYSSNGLFNGGYLEVISNDVEALYPYTYKKQAGTSQASYFAAKAKLYSNITVTAPSGMLTVHTDQGGTVEILYKGAVQQIHDRYHPSQGKIIYGVLYNYIPPKDFYGYDTFELAITNGSTKIIVSNKVYVAPDINDFKFNEIDFSGVYLLSNSDWLEEVKQGYANNDPYIKKWVDYYEAQYSNHFAAGVPAQARTAMEQLAILYKITNNKKYFDLLWAEILPVVNDGIFSPNTPKRLSWGQDSNGFLDAAMVTYSLAFAYNYIKDELSAEQQEIIMKALYEEGFYYFDNLKNENVLLHGNNHNLLVCGDLAIAALSAMSYKGTIVVNTRDHGQLEKNVQEMAANVVSTAFKYLQIGLVHYAENGGFPEGPSYSIYAHRNMVSLLATLRNLYGEDTNGKINSFGLSEIEGIMNYINYPLYTSSPNYESFYYAESDYSNNQPALLWYTRIDEDNYNAALLSKLADANEQYNIQSLLYYKPGLFEKVDPSNIEKLDFLLDEHELATFRSGFGNEMAIFTGLKGTNSDSGAFAHKNLDSGTFELYALGERFIGNFSNETYNVNVPDGYWLYDYQRWTYYKKNAQGQNTLVINPEEYPVVMQDPNEKAEIYDFKSNASSAFAKINLSKVYKNQAYSVQRGLKLFNDRTTVLVQDEFELRKPTTLYWSAHTEARIELINEKLARLTINNKSMYVLITSELGAFTYADATALPGTIGEFCNLDNVGVSKLLIKLENISEGTLSVVFVSSLEEIESLGSYPQQKLSDWTLEEGTKQTNNIVVENIEIEADFGKQYKYIFNPRQKEYVVKLSSDVKEVPNFNVTYDESKYDVIIKKSRLFNNISSVVVKDKTTGLEATYKFKFIVDTIIEGYQEYERATILNIVSDNKTADKICDDSNKSNFVANGKSEIIFELENLSKITNVLIRFSGGKINTYYFDIYYSEDGENYKALIYAGQSTNMIGDEVYTIGEAHAKYIKVVFTGNNYNDDVKVAEIAFLNNGYEIQAEVAKKGCGGCGGSIIGSLIGITSLAGIFVFKKKKEEKGE